VPLPLLRHLIGTALRRARQRQGRTLREVAAAAGVSVAYLSELERGRKEASSEVLAAVCRALGWQLSDLLDDVQDELARQRGREEVRPVVSARPAGSATARRPYEGRLCSVDPVVRPVVNPVANPVGPGRAARRSTRPGRPARVAHLGRVAEPVETHEAPLSWLDEIPAASGYRVPVVAGSGLSPRC
jgi:transcriptional regulator with XRE-family HTH domain